MIFSQSRGNLLVCKELTLEKTKSANFNFPHNQFNSKESVVFFLLAWDYALSLYLCNLFSEPKKQRSKRKITPDLRLSFCRPVASLFGCTIFSEYGTGIRGHWATTNLQIVLSTPKTPFLNQATQKDLAKFSYPKNSIDLSRHLKSEVPHLCPSLGRKQPFRDEIKG